MSEGKTFTHEVIFIDLHYFSLFFRFSSFHRRLIYGIFIKHLGNTNYELIDSTHDGIN